MTKAAEAGAKHGKPAQGAPFERGLIHTRSYEPPQVSGRDGYRRERYRRRRVAQRREVFRARREAGLDPYGKDGWAKPSRSAFCGRPLPFHGSVAVKVSNGHDGNAHAHFGGTQHCGNVWSCPVCGSAIRRERAAEITEGMRRHVSAGGGAVFVTFTVRHALGDALEDVKRTLLDAYADMARSRAFRSWKESAHFVGSIYSNETTYGHFGWHFHRHAVYLLDHEVTEAEAEMIEAELFGMWAHAVARVGGRTVSRDAFDVRPIGQGTETVAAYVTKLSRGLEGLGREVSIGDVKAGRAEGSIAPFQLLDIESAEAERLWIEYTQAMKGVSSVRWSRGLRDALGMAAERTDAEIVDDLEAVGGPVALIGRELYTERLAGRPGALCAVLEGAENQTLDDILTSLLGPEAYCVRIDDENVPMYLLRGSSLAA